MQSQLDFVNASLESVSVFLALSFLFYPLGAASRWFMKRVGD